MKRGPYICIISCLLLSVDATAQEYKYDAGVALGVGSYIGDANGGALFENVHLAYGALFRRTFNPRWAGRASITSMAISGDTHRSGVVLPDNRTHSFKSQLIDAGVQAEFNFLPYGSGPGYRQLARLSPYVTAGLGFTLGVAPGAPAFFNVNIPFGVGVKYKIAPRWNATLEFTMRKTFGDTLDGVGLDDPYHIDSSWIKNTDWYSCLLLSITYEFGVKGAVCNNQ